MYSFDKQILVVIPWLPSAQQGNELRWAVAGWRRHFKHPHRIVVVGEGVTGKVPASCTTHLPQWFEWDKWEALVERYAMDRVSYTIEDLYYNIYYPRRVFFQLDATDNLKFGLYEDNIPAERIRRVMARKIWLTNSPVGWSADLEAVLAEHFGGFVEIPYLCGICGSYLLS